MPSGLSSVSVLLHDISPHISIPDQGVDLNSGHVIQLLQSLLNLSLVCLDVDDENQSVILLDLLHGAFGVQWVNNHLVVIQSILMRDGLSWVFW